MTLANNKQNPASRRLPGAGLPFRLPVLLLLAFLLALLLPSCELAAPRREPGKVWVVTVGIEYEGIPHVDSLEGADAEARAVGDCLEYLALKADRPCDLSRFHDKGVASQTDPVFPSKVNIEKRLGEINNAAGPDDTLIVYFSCHGYPEEGEDNRKQEDAVYGDSQSFQRTTYICTIDSKGPLNPREAIKPGGAFWKCSDLIRTLKGFPGLEGFPAQKGFPGQKCVLADFCFSGSLIAENNVSFDSRIYSLGANDIDPFDDLLFCAGDVSQDPDLFILAASKPYEQSFIEGDGSLFTAAVLKALGWDAAGGVAASSIPACEAGVVTLQNVADRAQEFLDLSPSARRKSQHMKITGSSEDLVLFQFDRWR